MKTLIIRIALLALVNLPFTASFAAVVKFTAAGTITESWDDANIFGAELHHGAAYRHSISMDTDLLSKKDFGWGVNMAGGYAQPATVTTTIELGGKSFTWNWSAGEAYAYLWNYFPSSDLAQAGLSAQIVHDDGSFIASIIDMRSQVSAFLNNLDFGETRAFNDLSGIHAYSSFTFSSAQGQSWFLGTPGTLVWEASKVPEPGSWSLLLTGALILCALRYRRFQL